MRNLMIAIIVMILALAFIFWYGSTYCSRLINRPRSPYEGITPEIQKCLDEGNYFKLDFVMFKSS